MVADEVDDDYLPDSFKDLLSSAKKYGKTKRARLNFLTGVVVAKFVQSISFKKPTKRKEKVVVIGQEEKDVESLDHHRRPHHKKLDNNPIRNDQKKKRMKETVLFENLGLDPPPNLVQAIKQQVGQEGDTNPIFLIMKPIYKTDLNPHHDRLTLPCNQVVVGHEGFLTSLDEVESIHEKGKSGGLEIMVIMLLHELGHDYGNNINEYCYKLKLRSWKLTSSWSLVVTSGWRDVVDANKELLKEKVVVQIYCFRRDGKLWLVMLKVRDGNPIDDIGQVHEDWGNSTVTCL